jgi:hypothetical protein
MTVNKKLNIMLPAALLAVTLSTSVKAAVVVDWDLSGAAGTETSLIADSSAMGVTGLALTEGTGLTPNAGANSMNARGWNSKNQ